MAGRKKISGGYSLPSMVLLPTTLTDGATIATDASLGNFFRVTLTGSPHALSNPTNLVDGQRLTWEIIQDGTGTRLLTYGTVFTFGGDVVNAIVSTAPNKRDFLSAVYNSTAAKLYVVSFVRGY